jgi:hypothetical protein
MPRIFPLGAIIAVTVLTLAVAAAQPRAAAQDGTPAAASEHPFIGAWIVDTDTTDATNFPALAVATADGTYLESHPDVGVGVGSWEATGEQTVTLIIVFRAPSETGTPIGLVTAHATIEMTEDGDVWEAPYSFEGVAPDGTVLFAGEGRSRAVRVGAEPVFGLATPGAVTPAP